MGPNGEDAIFLDEDSDSSDNFEICIENAGNQKKKRKDSEDNDSFDRNSSDDMKGGGFHNGGGGRGGGVIEISDDIHLNDFMNSSGTKRQISTAISKVT